MPNSALECAVAVGLPSKRDEQTGVLSSINSQRKPLMRWQGTCAHWEAQSSSFQVRTWSVT